MKLLRFTARVLVLTLLLGIFFILGAQLAGVGKTAETKLSATPPPATEFWAPFLLFCVCVTIVMAYLSVRSGRYGFKLMATLAFIMYSVMTIASQVESLFFLQSKMPLALIERLFLQGAITTLLFVPCVVIIMGQLHSRDREAPPAFNLVPASTWLLRLAATVVLFEFLYMFFGYFVAWQNPELRQYYGGGELNGFFSALQHNWQYSPSIYALQVLRSLLFFACIMLVVRKFRGPRWEAALASSAFLTVWTLILLLPNPIMPPSVARSHFWETFFCYLIFGALLGWMLAGKKEPAVMAKTA
jgi:hypothetical protein